MHITANAGEKDDTMASEWRFLKSNKPRADIETSYGITQNVGKVSYLKYFYYAHFCSSHNNNEIVYVYVSLKI